MYICVVNYINMQEDFIRELGYLGFATRLKRLGDSFMQEGRRLYQKLDIDIEPNWYLIFKMLSKHKELGVTEIADKLQLAHPSVISITNKMEKAGYLISAKCDSDSRRRVLKLTKKAKNKMPEYEKIWEAGTIGLEKALEGFDALAHLKELEERFEKIHFRERTLNELQGQQSKEEVQIIDYDPKYSIDFAEINFQWLEAFFYIEDYDRMVLTEAKTHILDKGGHILFAIYQGKAVGTVALILREGGDYELSKMGVLEGYRGLKIGQKLMDAAIAYCRKKGMKRVWLDSNRKLTPAITLYRKNGFEEIEVDPNTPYERCNIRMEKWLD